MNRGKAIMEAVARITARQRPILGHGVVRARTQIDNDAMEAPPQRTDFERLAQAGAALRGVPRPLTPQQEAGIARTIFAQRGAESAERIAALLNVLAAQARTATPDDLRKEGGL